MQSAQEQVHRETLEQEATHATDEARMVLPGVQAVLGFQLVALFNQRFELLSPAEQVLHLASISRELSYNDYQNPRASAGSPADRNALLPLAQPWPYPGH